ncbi:Uncharacterised protein [Mycobacteroides abscessus subsp. abscessus]|nr:Uncharacterised protein [Mycobacteroides abscessus subsp. abscessus]
MTGLRVQWPPCPKWCGRNPDPAVDYVAGGHLDDLRDDGSGAEVEIRVHERSWKLPRSGRGDVVQAIELEALEHQTATGTRLGEVHLLVDSDAGQYLSLEAAAAAATAIKALLGEVAGDVSDQALSEARVNETTAAAAISTDVLLAELKKRTIH